MKRVALVVGVCLTLLAMSLGCGEDRDPNRISADVGASAAVALVDNHIQGMISGMEILAMTDEVKSGDWEQMKGLLAELKHDGIPAVIWFVLPDGSYFTVEKGKVDKNLSDRAYFPGLMAGDNQLSGLLFSKSTGKKMFVAAVPVKDGEGVIGGLGASILLEGLSKTIADELQLPGDMIFYAVDAQGEITLHSDASLLMEEGADLGESTAVAMMISPLMGWHFTLAF